MALQQIEIAVILAAGPGKKSWPYGATQNKAVFPIATRPLIIWTVAALRQWGISSVWVVTGYRGDQIQHALRQEPNIHFVAQKEASGTAHALALALNKMNLPKNQHVVVLYGDVLFTQENMQKLLQNPEPDPAVLVCGLDGDDSRDWLCAEVKNEEIRQIVGHPRGGVTHRIAGGFILPAAKVLPYLEKNFGRMQSIEVGQMPADEALLEQSLQSMLEDGWSIRAIVAEKPCTDMDKPWHLLQANGEFVRHLTQQLQSNKVADGAKISPKAFVDGFVKLGKNSEIGPGCFIKGNLIVGENVRITDGAIIEGNCVIGDQAVVQRYCQLERGTAIGHHCFVGHGAEFSGLMMDRAYFYHYGEYWGILGTACDLGAATVCGNLRFDDDQTVHRIAGRRERPNFGANAAYLGDYVRTGVNTILMPGAKVGPYSVLGAGTIISGDVPERTLVYVEQQLQRKSWGPERYGW